MSEQPSEIRFRLDVKKRINRKWYRYKVFSIDRAHLAFKMVEVAINHYPKHEFRLRVMPGDLLVSSTQWIEACR